MPATLPCTGIASSADPLHFRIALHTLHSAPSSPGREEIRRFYARLYDVIRARGHTLELFPEMLLPPPADGAVSLGYHSTGRQPGTWHIKLSYLRGYFYFDRDGYSGWSEMACSPDVFAAAMAEDEAGARAFVDRFRADYFDAGTSKHAQPELQFHAEGRPYVFMPLQVLGDRVLRLSRVGFAEFARGVAAGLAGSGLRLVVKRHPRCTGPEVFRLLAELSAMPHVQVTAAAIHGLIRNAEAVVCINSGVGFEALFHYRPVFTAGRSDYEGVTRHLASKADLADVARRIGPVDEGRVARFLSYFCRRYLVRGDDEAAIHRRIERVEAEAGLGIHHHAADRANPRQVPD